MTALGQKQTLKRLQPMSALRPKADIGTQSRNVRFVPIAEIRGICRDRQANRLCGRQIDDELELSWLFDRQIRWLRALQYLLHICRAKPKEIGHARAIRHQTACKYIFASCKYRGNSVTFKKVDDLTDLQSEECVRQCYQRVANAGSICLPSSYRDQILR